LCCRYGALGNHNKTKRVNDVLYIMETIIAVSLFSSPIIIFIIMGNLGLGFSLNELFEDWKVLKILALILFFTYMLVIVILGHQEIAEFESKGYRPFKDGWLEYYLIPGVLFSSIIVPKIVGNKITTLSRLSYEAAEEIILVFGWFLLIIWLIGLLSNWNYHH
jgi:hypothetical protein